MVFLDVRREDTGFLSSCDGDLRKSLMFPQGSQSFQSARGTLGFLSSRFRRIGPHLALRGESHDVA